MLPDAPRLKDCTAQGSDVYCVYLLERISDPTRRYVGITSQTLEARLAEHNSGKSTHTDKHKPWPCVVQLTFTDKTKAENFERYLKHGSGHAFAKRHFW